MIDELLQRLSGTPAGKLAGEALSSVDWDGVHQRSQESFDRVRNAGSSLALESGMVPYHAGDFQRSGPQVRQQGIGEALAGAFDVHKPWGVGDTVNAALMAMPGMRMGPRGASPVLAAEKGGSPMPPAGEAASPLITEYGQRLKQALGNREAWEPLMKELQADPRVALPDLVRISSDFYGGIPKGSSRTKAIDNINRRHQKLVDWKDELDRGVLK